jgi:hypothetical protein
VSNVGRTIRVLLESAATTPPNFSKGKRPITDERKADDDRYAELRRALDNDRRSSRAKTKVSLPKIGRKWDEKSALPKPPKPPESHGDKMSAISRLCLLSLTPGKRKRYRHLST